METELTAEDRQLLQRLEEELWREETRFDVSRMEEVIAEDFFEFGRSGRIYQRADTLAVPSTPIEAVIPLPDFDARLLAEGIAQVTYNSVVTYGENIEEARRSSIWTRSSGGWKLRFHQGTPFSSDD